MLSSCEDTVYGGADEVLMAGGVLAAGGVLMAIGVPQSLASGE
ncbi:hypothetical protein [Pseudoflavitalea rhizosphaerae]|nr:hypothetical protein [Pseudoflavitalea rhizosphaerae]